MSTTGISRVAGVGLERAADLEAVRRRHHDVEQDEVRGIAPDAVERGAAVGDRFDLVAVTRQQRRHELPVGFDIVDHEHAADAGSVRIGRRRSERVDTMRHT